MNQPRSTGSSLFPPPIAVGLFLALTAVVGPLRGENASANQPLSRILFGSCCNQKRPQVIWKAIAASQPELFLFLGDNIYADTSDPVILRAKYGELLASPGYQAVRSICPILATWDDHDYGANDAGAEFPQREASQRLFVEAFGIPPDRGPAQRPGVYDAHVFGPEGRRLQIILLDTRYFRGPLRKGGGDWPRNLGSYGENPDPTSSMLGQEQWIWLEEQLRQPAEVRIIGSSIQVLPLDTHWERWQNLPHERSRILQLLRDGGNEPVILLSGDRHMAELMRYEFAPNRFLHEITSSGLSHAGGGQDGEPNRFRIGTNFRDLNFGSVTIDWSGSTPSIRVAIHDASGTEVSELSIR
jgi:alkaline phosphatase D